MVLDQEHAVEAEGLGLADVIDVIAVDPAVAGLLAGVGARAAEQSEPHYLALPPAIPLPDCGRGWPRAIAHGRVRAIMHAQASPSQRFAVSPSLSRIAGEGLSAARAISSFSPRC